jgi:molybdopterin-guanine dinucleotide biosynthesis protein MobB
MKQPGEPRRHPPAISVIGRKNSGKTTLLVGVAAELKRRGYRVASVKHCHHDFDLDRPGSDSWRHFHEGGADGVLLAAPGRVALLARSGADEPSAESLIRTYLAPLAPDIVLVEAFTTSELPKLEVFRRSLHDRPLYGQAEARVRGSYIGIVTDDPEAVEAGVPVVVMSADGSHIASATDLVIGHMRNQADTSADTS